jgi:hypothetical protein
LYRDADTAVITYPIGAYSPGESYIQVGSGAAPVWSARIAGRTYNFGNAAAGTWYFAAYGWDVDLNTGIAAHDASFATNTLLTSAVTPAFHIGRLNMGSPIYWPGRIGTVGVANRLLTAAELLDIYRATYRS